MNIMNDHICRAEGRSLRRRGPAAGIQRTLGLLRTRSCSEHLCTADRVRRKWTLEELSCCGKEISRAVSKHALRGVSSQRSCIGIHDTCAEEVLFRREYDVCGHASCTCRLEEIRPGICLVQMGRSPVPRSSPATTHRDHKYLDTPGRTALTFSGSPPNTAIFSCRNSSARI